MSANLKELSEYLLTSMPQELAAEVDVFTDLGDRVLISARPEDDDNIPPQERLSTLSPRQYEAVLIMAHGLSNAEIAAAMGLSEHGVHQHLSGAYTKLDYVGRIGAARFIPVEEEIVRTAQDADRRGATLLTRKQRPIWDGIKRGLTNKQIALETNRSLGGVKAARPIIFGNLGLTDPADWLNVRTERAVSALSNLRIYDDMKERLTEALHPEIKAYLGEVTLDPPLYEDLVVSDFQASGSVASSLLAYAPNIPIARRIVSEELESYYGSLEAKAA